MTRRDSQRSRQRDSSENVWNSARRLNAEAESMAHVAGEIQNGRQLAYAVLQEFERSDQFIQDILSRLDASHQLRSSDRALAVDIAAGVVRRSRTLDVVLQSRMSRARHQVEPDLWRVLRIGAYQLLFAKTPDHAAVDSSVELCRDLNRHRWTGFVNGVLRNIGRLISETPVDGPSGHSVPMASNQWIALQEDILPDPNVNLVDWISDAFSLPGFLAARWHSRFASDQNTLLAVCMRSISPPETSLRVNALQSSTENLLKQFQDAGCDAAAGATPGAISLKSPVRIDSLPGYSEGSWSVQDEAAMAASVLLNPQPGERILDLCAAPGGKTTHLAELSRDHATITACDVANIRLRRIEDNARRLKLTSIQTQLIGKDGNGIPEGPFDAILVDVPCSNTGVLNRRPEARWRCDEKSLKELVVLQTRLLLEACERVRPGGRIVYSTCSLEPEENRGVVDAVLRAKGSFRLTAERLHLPGLPADGAYQALMVHDSVITKS